MVNLEEDYLRDTEGFNTHLLNRIKNKAEAREVILSMQDPFRNVSTILCRHLSNW